VSGDVRLVFRDPIGRVVFDMTTRLGTRWQVGAGVPSNMLAVGWVDVLEPGQAIPDPPAVGAAYERVTAKLRQQGAEVLVSADEAQALRADPCADGRCTDPEAHAEGAHDL
jgi:hypothetical protein